jgi:DNA-binding transcriptional regulator YiaG
MSTTDDLIRIRAIAASGLARKLREHARLSRAEVADAAGVHRNSILRWESGARCPRGDAAIRWLRILEDLQNA